MLYSSDYETLNDFCDELFVALKELFICDVKREKKRFCVEIHKGREF